MGGLFIYLNNVVYAICMSAIEPSKKINLKALFIWNFILKTTKHRTYFVKVLKTQWRFHAVCKVKTPDN